MTCPLCLAMSGRFNAQNECCQVRLLARAPGPHRKEVYARTRQTGGATAEAELKAKVRAEFQRQQALVQAALQREQAIQTAKGREQSAAILKDMKEKGMHLPLLDRALAGAGRLLKAGLSSTPNQTLGFA